MQIGQILTTKYYVGGDYEVEDKDREITRVHYIYAPSGLAAIVRRDAQNNDAINFVLNDHLGSVQVLANAAGQLLEEFSYDPWGLRRDPVTLDVYAWAEMPVTGMDYGFTGHEHLDIFMLVNMNGRMYDPVVGRFLTPDPVLQFPNYTQGLNPYAYALNNPLRFVDPDGYSLAGQFLALTVSIAIAPFNPWLAITAYSVIMTVDYAIEQGRNVRAGEIYGYFVQTFVMSAISMGATQGIGDYFKLVKNKNLLELRRALAHATFNGTMRFAQGGKFEHGFLSGFVSSLGGSFMQANTGNMSTGAQVTMSAVIGGTAEKLGGGKFANGAVTGAYVMMFNHLGKISEYDELPPVNNTKNWEYARVEGVDYLFFDNQWIELPQNDYIYKGKDPDPLGVGDIEVVIPRETIAVYQYIKRQEVLWGTLSGAGLESFSSIAKTLYNWSVNGVRISPVGFTVSYISGSAARILYMDTQMRKHDLQVEDLRRR